MLQSEDNCFDWNHIFLLADLLLESIFRSFHSVPSAFYRSDSAFRLSHDQAHYIALRDHIHPLHHGLIIVTIFEYLNKLLASNLIAKWPQAFSGTAREKNNVHRSYLSARMGFVRKS